MVHRMILEPKGTTFVANPVFILNLRQLELLIYQQQDSQLGEQSTNVNPGLWHGSSWAPTGEVGTQLDNLDDAWPLHTASDLLRSRSAATLPVAMKGTDS